MIMGLTSSLLKMVKVVNKLIYIGTSGWCYDHWRGKFYPEEIKNWLAGILCEPV